MGFLQETIPLRGSILQAGTCQISSLAEGPRWSQVWQYTCPFPQTKTKTIIMGGDKDRLTQDKLGLSSAKLSRAKFGCIEVMIEVVSKDNLN